MSTEIATDGKHPVRFEGVRVGDLAGRGWKVSKGKVKHVVVTRMISDVRRSNETHCLVARLSLSFKHSNYFTLFLESNIRLLL